MFEKKGNEVLTRVIFFGPGESKSVCIQVALLSHIVRDRLLVVLIMDREWPLLSGCDKTCFRYKLTRKTNDLICSRPRL